MAQAGILDGINRLNDFETNLAYCTICMV